MGRILYGLGRPDQVFGSSHERVRFWVVPPRTMVYLGRGGVVRLCYVKGADPYLSDTNPTSERVPARPLNI